MAHRYLKPQPPLYIVMIVRNHGITLHAVVRADIACVW